MGWGEEKEDGGGARMLEGKQNVDSYEGESNRSVNVKVGFDTK